jgi:hypothetical protein
MTQFTTVTLIPETVYGQASGNYDGSSQEWYGNAVPAANYYRGQGSLQTITYQLQDFVGEIKIWATLNDLPDTAPWFEIDSYGDGSTVITETHPVTITGNFAWLRAEVIGFDGGTIQQIRAAY